MATPEFKVGELVWELKVDMARMEENLLRAESKLDKSKEKQGGILGFLTSKWALVGATAAGVGYAMIKASPSLSYAMEEISFRFEDMLAILGEQFAPLLEEIVLPALDKFMPLIEELAPMVGEVVGMVIEALKPLAPIFDRVLELIGGALGDLFSRLTTPAMQNMLSRLVEAFGKIATAVLDIAERVLPLLFNIFDIIGPPIIETFVGVVELIADIFGGEDGVASMIVKVIDKLEGPLTSAITFISGVWDTLRTEVIQPVINIFSGLWQWIKDVADRLDVGGVFSKAIKWISDKLESLYNFLVDVKEGLEDIVTLGGRITFGGATGTPFIMGAQTGRIIPRTGPYWLHAGEEVVPPQSARFGGGGPSIGQVIIQIDSVQLSGDMDVYDFADRLSRRFKEDVERLWY